MEAPQGKLGKADKVLVGFAKTKELAPGESEELILPFHTAALLPMTTPVLQDMLMHLY